MRKKKFQALPVSRMADLPVRLVRVNNKTIVLLERGDSSPFSQACSLLSSIGSAGGAPRVISVDAMVVEYERGEVRDQLGCVAASLCHEVVVYEDRGEDLAFLRQEKSADPADGRGPSTSNGTIQSGSARLQERTEAAREAEAEAQEKLQQPSTSLIRRIHQVACAVLGTPERQVAPRAEAEADRRRRTRKKTRYKADMGVVRPPSLIPALSPSDHALNALREYQAVLEGTHEVNLRTCRGILQAYTLGSEGLLKDMLEEAEAAIYDNSSSQVIRGLMSGQYMAAYNGTRGLVELAAAETQRTDHPIYDVPPTDPMVVVARCTRIALEGRIMERLKGVAENWASWNPPEIIWMNGVPGCGKTAWIVGTFDADRDILITTTTEAANDAKARLAQRMGDRAQSRVRTMASVLVNGFRGGHACNRLIVDEALMNHFGAVIMSARLSGASVLVLLGDVNQLPYIDRDNLFDMGYCSPCMSAVISQEMLCTKRCPRDVAYALKNIYGGVYSSSTTTSSLQLKGYRGETIPTSTPNTLFLVHTQEEKSVLIAKGYGSGEGSRLLTIHEAQGLTFENVVAIQTKSKRSKLHDSVPHAVVAISRHTNSCVYYSDICDDAISSLIRGAATSRKSIIDYNLKMAIKRRDMGIVEVLAAAGMSCEQR